MLKANATAEPESAEFLTSSQAAKRLGLSMATIQKLVDNHILQAWKTYGGHRRISLSSVLNYQNTNMATVMPLSTSELNSKAMVVLESPDLVKRLKSHVAQWAVPLHMTFSDSLTEALLDLLNDKNDLLIVQMSSPRKQQEKALEILQKFMGSRNTVGHALILTNEEKLLPAAKTSVYPVSIQVINHALSPEWLSAYWTGFAVQRKR